MNLGLDAGADSAAGVLGPLGPKAGKGVGARFQMAGAKGAANGGTPGFMALLSALEPAAQTLGQQIPRAMSGGPTTAERGVLPQEVGNGVDGIAAGGAGGADLADATGSSDAGDSDLMLLLAQSDAMASGARPEPELMRLETAEAASGLALNAPLHSNDTNEQLALKDVEPALSIPAGQESLLLLPTAAGWLPPTVAAGSQTSGSQLALATNSSLDVASTPQGPETQVPGKLPARPEETMQSGNGGAFIPSPERHLRLPLENVMAKIETADQFVPSPEQAGPAQTAVLAMLGNTSPAQKHVADASVSMSKQEASGFMALAPRDVSMTDQQSGSQSHSQSQGQGNGQKEPMASTELSAAPMRADTPWTSTINSFFDVASTPQGPETYVPGKLPARPEETIQSGNGGAFVPSPERQMRSPLENVTVNGSQGQKEPKASNEFSAAPMRADTPWTSAINSSLDVSSTPQGTEIQAPGKLPARLEETMQSGNGGAFIPSPERHLRPPLESVMAKIEVVDQFLPSPEQVGPAQTAVSAMLGNSSPAQKPVADASVSMSKQEASGFMALAPRDVSMTDQQSGSQSHSQSQGQGNGQKEPMASTELSAVPMRTDTPWAQALASQEIRYEARDVFTPLSAETPEATLAENVTYWAAQGVQNAELKLDAWGGEALEVSISMNGNQAEVEFRTDQSEIREVIEGAMTQLKDMLAEEGLVLSGVAVGTSSGQGGGTSERRPPQGSRQAVRQAISEEASAVGRRHGTGMGQALDLFV